MFKNSINILPEAVSSLFTRNDDHHDYNTRVRRSLHVPVGKTASVYRTFRFCGIKIWNYIKANIIIDNDNDNVNEITLFRHIFIIYRIYFY